MDTRTIAEIEADIKKLPGGATFPTNGMKKAQLLALEATLKAALSTATSDPTTEALKRIQQTGEEAIRRIQEGTITVHDPGKTIIEAEHVRVIKQPKKSWLRKKPGKS